MKNKLLKMCSVSLVYILVMGIVFNFVPTIKVNAQGYSFTSLDQSSTLIQNKYGIKGEIISTKLYSDCTVVVTSIGIYTIKGDQVTSYTNCEPTPTGNISRNGNNLLITPVGTIVNAETYEIGYSTAEIDLNTNTLSLINQFSNYLTDYDYYEIENASVDSNSKQWFSALTCNGSDYYYRLFRASSDGTSKLITQYDQIAPGHYNEVFSNIKQDSSNNAYYTVFNKDYDNISNNIYKLERVNGDDTVTSISFTDRVTDYVVTDSGDIWSIVGTDKLIHQDKNGQTISTFSLTNGKSITKDNSGNIYVFDDNTLKKVENNTLNVAVGLNTEEGKSKNISMLDENNFLLNSAYNMVLTTNDIPEYTEVGSYVDASPRVVKDNLGNIFILSRNNYDGGENYLKIVRINADGAKEFSIITGLEGDLTTARAYNGELYFIDYYNTIYKIKGENKEIYEETDGISMMEIDSLGSLYWINSDEDMMVKINKDKTKINYDLSTAKTENGGSTYWLTNILIDKYNNAFLTLNKYITNSDIYKASSSGAITKLDTSSVSNGSSLINVFLDENNEFNVIFGDDYKLNQDQSTFTKNTELSGDSAVYGAKKIVKASDGNLLLISSNGFFIKSPTDSKFVKQTGSASGIDYTYLYWVGNIEVDNSGRIYFGANYELFVSSPITFNFNPIKEDINHDGVVNIVDLAETALNYNTKSSSANWNNIIDCDVNMDNIVDIYDLVKVSKLLN